MSLSITVWGDAERAMWAEANADARADAQWEFENLCPQCGEVKQRDAVTCWVHMAEDDRRAAVNAMPRMRLVRL